MRRAEARRVPVGRGRSALPRLWLSRRLTAAACAVGLVATAYVVTAGSEEPPPGSSRPSAAAPASARFDPDLELAWSEEFDDDELDTDVWEPYHSTYGHANNELQCYTPDNVEVRGGTLRLTARRERTTCPQGKARAFSSGFVGTRETGTYFPRVGRFEVRARVPHGQGLWPAFWLRHRDGAKVAEVDVLEYFHARHPGRSSSTLHLDGERNTFQERSPFEAPTASPDWHTWAVEIERVAEGVAFTFSVDGGQGEETLHRFVDTSPAWFETHPGAELWDLALNLSVGGDWVGDPDGPLGVLPALDRCAQEGDPEEGCVTDGIRRADFPATFEIDHVRIYRSTR